MEIRQVSKSVVLGSSDPNQQQNLIVDQEGKTDTEVTS